MSVGDSGTADDDDDGSIHDDVSACVSGGGGAGDGPPSSVYGTYAAHGVGRGSVRQNSRWISAAFCSGTESVGSAVDCNDDEGARSV